LLEELRRGTDEHATKMLGRTVRDEISLRSSGHSVERIQDDAGLQDDGFRVERSGFESGNNTLSFAETTCDRNVDQEKKAILI
jgi:hypothetical protein